MEPSRFLTPAIVARRLDLSDKTIIRLIKSGRMKAHKVGKLWKIPEESYRKYLQETSFYSSN